jgi:hypothetical protein
MQCPAATGCEAWRANLLQRRINPLDHLSGPPPLPCFLINLKEDLRKRKESEDKKKQDETRSVGGSTSRNQFTDEWK